MCEYESIRISNDRKITLTIQFEPYGHSFDLEPGAAAEILLINGKISGNIIFDFGDSYVSISEENIFATAHIVKVSGLNDLEFHLK